MARNWRAEQKTDTAVSYTHLDVYKRQEIREFVKTFENVDWIKPKLTFRKVIEKYGYPFIGKEISNCIYLSLIHISAAPPIMKERRA